MKTKRFSRTKALAEVGVSYLGATTQSAKLTYSHNKGVETYGIYLAPQKLARDAKHPNINVCPFSSQCADSCLSGAGHNKVEMLKNGNSNCLTRIDKCRIKKTHLFYDDREKFMDILISELDSYKIRAEKNDMQFAVRLNCTSDLSPEVFKKDGKNILEMYPNVQFYDYTKVPQRLALAEKYDNYFLVFSYDGENKDVCREYLAKGGNVAVVFDLYDEKGKQILPETFLGYKVIDGNLADDRFNDETGVIVGLHYHKVGKDYVKGKYVPRNTPFVVREV